MEKYKLSSILKEKQLDAFKSDKRFDWEEFEDTDFNGPEVEMAILNLIDDFEQQLQSEFPADPNLRNQARIAIKQLFDWNLKSWKDRNKGRGIPGGE